MVDGKRGWCPFYRVWADMLVRCHSENYQSSHPTYIGCTVAAEWHRFSTFKSWMEQQDWEGNQLDKDLLVEGNKMYSPDTCVFVSKQVNIFLTENKTSVAGYPTGVHYHKQAGRFKAQCRCLSKGQKSLGLFDTPEEAHEAYKVYKRRIAIELAALQTNERIAQAILKRYHE